MVISTFLSDFFLSCVSLFMAYKFKGLSSVSARAALYAFSFVGISAGLGSLHFLGVNAIDPVYKFTIGLAGCVGVPLLGVSFFHFGIRPLSDKLFFFKFFGMLIAFLCFTYIYPFPLYATIASGLAMVIVIVVSILKFSRERNGAILGLVGAVLFVLAGLVIGTSGSRGPILNVDLFHVGLAIANYCIGSSILRLK